jgi:ATP-dependent Clp protease ATP-binding subunit ClpA
LAILTISAKRTTTCKNTNGDQLATDLTALAEENKLDPVIGRQMELKE